MLGFRDIQQGTSGVDGDNDHLFQTIIEYACTGAVGLLLGGCKRYGYLKAVIGNYRELGAGNVEIRLVGCNGNPDIDNIPGRVQGIG